jgi:hypothetical protein
MQAPVKSNPDYFCVCAALHMVTACQNICVCTRPPTPVYSASNTLSLADPASQLLTHLWLHPPVLCFISQVAPQALEGPLTQLHARIVILLYLDEQLDALQLLLCTLLHWW